MLHFDLKQKPRFSVVSYLNTLPLVWGILHGEQRDLVELDFCVPAECADRLASGEADVGIIPCAELLRQDLEVIPGTGIACEGAVRTILLISKVPPGRIRTLATDSSSRTSVMLARILLARKYGLEPVLVSMKPDLDTMLAQADAALIIGDPALHLDPEKLPFHVLDLGQEWTGMTGLPMVFAVWVGRKNGGFGALAEPLQASLQYGMAHLQDIVKEGSQTRGITPELAHHYLTENIRFQLAEREYEGMRTFLQYASELGALAPLGTLSA